MMLAQSNSGMIGVVIPQQTGNRLTLKDPYFSLLVGTLDCEIRKRNLHMYLIAQQTEEEILRQAAAWNLEGLIVCNFQEQELLSLRRKYRKPLVSIDSYLSEKTDFINIRTDDFGGGYTMGRYLVSKGHKKIAMLADNDWGVDHFRWLGFKQALEEGGIEVQEKNHIIFSPTESIRALELELLLPKIMEYTAIFVASDFYALEIGSFLQNKMVRVPDQISIAGFDDLIYAQLARPKLTTIGQNVGRKAVMAIDALQNFRDKDALERKYVLDVELVERNLVKDILQNAQNL